MRSNDASRHLPNVSMRDRAIELELDQLIEEQVDLLKQPSRMDDGDIFEFYLRHSRIMLLCREVTDIPHGHGDFARKPPQHAASTAKNFY